MNDIFKQRLVGALILVALGVVFWPIIFVEPGQPERGEQAEIPPRPAVDTTPVEPPDRAGLRPSPELQSRREQAAAEPTTEQLDPAPVPVEVEAGGGAEPPPAESGVQTAAAEPKPKPEPEPEPERTRSEAPVSPEIDAEGVPIAWILQVVSVSSAEKAEQLRTRLLDMDQKVYVKKVRRGESNLYRVYIGPKFERARLEAIKPRIDAEFGVSSMVIRYLP